MTLDAIGSDGDEVEATFLPQLWFAADGRELHSNISGAGYAEVTARMVESIRLLKLHALAIAEERDESDFDSSIDD